MAVSLNDIRNDVGELYSATENGTTTVNGLISKSGSLVAAITGTTTGYDLAVRDLTDHAVCQHILGGVDPVSKNVGNLSVGAKEIVKMRDGFLASAERFLKIKGYSVDGLAIKAELIN
jgi:hypothetical protein